MNFIKKTQGKFPDFTSPFKKDSKNEQNSKTKIEP